MTKVKVTVTAVIDDNGQIVAISRDSKGSSRPAIYVKAQILGGQVAEAAKQLIECSFDLEEFADRMKAKK